MGTRSLTTVILDGQTRIAQYGHWDGYPEGQGADILKFLSEPGNVAALRTVVAKVHFADGSEADSILSLLAPDLVSEQWITMIWIAALPGLSRDLGGGILQALVEADDPRTYNPRMFMLKDSRGFFEDTVWCAWAYTVDLDKGTLTVFVPPHKLAEFSLDDLPTEDEFVRTLQEAANTLV